MLHVLRADGYINFLPWNSAQESCLFSPFINFCTHVSAWASGSLPYTLGYIIQDTFTLLLNLSQPWPLSLRGSCVPWPQPRRLSRTRQPPLSISCFDPRISHFSKSLGSFHWRSY